MSATLSGAAKAYLESLGLGVPCYRDGAPRDREGALATSWPFVVLQEGIGYEAEQHGDTDDDESHLGTVELLQVDLYQLARSAQLTGPAVVTENYQLPSQVEAALRRARRGLAAHAPWRVYGVTMSTAVRWPISDNVLRHTWTIRVRRDTEWKAA